MQKTEDELVEKVAAMICEAAPARLEAEMLPIDAPNIARAIIPLVATALRAELPDDIDLFRIIRKAGRSDKAKAQAVAAAIRGAA